VTGGQAGVLIGDDLVDVTPDPHFLLDTPSQSDVISLVSSFSQYEEFEPLISRFQ
jgi:hypothetical protein